MRASDAASMHTMYLIIAIILIIWIVRVSNKVTALEQKIMNMGQAPRVPVVPRVAPAATQQDASASTHVSGAPVVMASEPVPLAPAAKPMPEGQAEEKEDGEFVWAKYLARAGVGAILAGVAFFLKLAIDYGWIGVLGRVAIGVIIGVIGLVIGQVLRAKYKSYSNVLIGGGLAVLYVTVFFSHYYYKLISSPVALGLMIGITLISVLMSVVDKEESLARIGIVGGFLAPLLISVEHSGMFDLFTYALILDIGVLVTAFSKRWHGLNFIAFVGTFILYSVGLMQSFTPDLRIPVLLFTTVFFIVFLAVSVMHHLIRKEKSSSADVVFITLNAIWYGVAVYGLMSPVAANLLGFYMLGIALIYAATAFISFNVDRSDRMLNQYLTGLCVVFLTAAIPMQFDGSWITIMWFVEALVLFVVDYSLRGKNLYALGGVVFGLGLFRYFALDSFERVDMGTWSTIFNSRFFMLLVIVIVALVLGYIAKKASRSIAVSAEEGITERDIKSLRWVGAFFFVIANLLSIYLITSEITYHYRQDTYAINQGYDAKMNQNTQYQGEEGAFEENNKLWTERYEKIASVQNRKNVAVSIAWAIYAASLLVFGFMRKSKGFRIAGLVFIFITLFKVFIDIWNFGGIYRVVGSVAVGIIALLGSFLYAKYKHRIKDAIVVGAIVSIMALGSAFALSAMPSVADAGVADTSSRYGAPIDTKNVTGSVMLDIPPSVLSKTSIDDIRIYNQDIGEVPYVVLDGNVSAGQGVISAAITNSTSHNGQSSAVLDLGRVGLIHNSVSLDVSGADSFSRTVTIYASDTVLPADSTAWKLVTSTGYVYSYLDTRAGLSAWNTTVPYPKNTSRFMKVVISAASSGSANPALSILGARVSPVSPVYGVREDKVATISPNHVSVMENSMEKSTEITIDLGESGIYSNQVTLALASSDQQFMRRAVVQHMDSVDGAISSGNWAMLADRTIFSIAKPLFSGSDLTIPYPEIKSRFIRVVVFNKDDKPVSFSKNPTDIKIASRVRSILFDAKEGKTYSMYFGNPSAVRPQYDFASIRAYEDASPMTATLGSVFENQSYRPAAEAQKPWTDRNRTVLNVSLVILVLAFGGLVYVYVRKARVGGAGGDNGQNSPLLQ